MENYSEPDVDNSGRRYFVVGCPRSETSLFAKFLCQAGLTTVQDGRANQQYPSGYYERPEIAMFHGAVEKHPAVKGLLTSIRKTELLREELFESSFLQDSFRSAFRPILEDEIDLLKYPQLALSIDFLLENIEGLYIIAVWRKPVCTFRSLVQKEFDVSYLPASLLKSVSLWGMYAFHIVRAPDRHPDRVTVYSIDEFVDRNRTVPLDELSMERGSQSSGTISDCVDPDLWTTDVGGAGNVCSKRQRVPVEHSGLASWVQSEPTLPASIIGNGGCGTSPVMRNLRSFG